MSGFQEFIYKDKTIHCLDLAGLKIHNKPEFLKHVAEAKEQIQKYSPKSLLIITNVANTGFDTEVAAIVGEYAAHNTNYVKASAIVGVSGVQKIALTTIRALTGRDFYIADTMEEAKDWLVRQ
jgi:hypothetical protein